VPQETCFRHRQKHSAYRCQSCSKPLCDKCIVNGRFCSEGCNKKYSKFVADYQAPTKREGLGFGQLLFSLLLIAAAAGGLWYAKQQGLF